MVVSFLILIFFKLKNGKNELFCLINCFKIFVSILDYFVNNNICYDIYKRNIIL